MVMAALTKTIKDSLKEKWTPELEEAWKVTLDIISSEMISDNYSQIPKFTGTDTTNMGFKYDYK